MKGIIYAFLAAVCNSCIGIFNNILLEQGISSKEIAFLRCLIALIFTFAICICNKNIRKSMKIKFPEAVKFALLAFFGINIMYLFETTAVKYIPVSLVSFLLYASGIITIILSCIFLHESLNPGKIISIILVFIGIGIMFITNFNIEGNITGILCAITAGAGYSLYIFFNKKWNVESGLRTLFYIFLFGTVFLGIMLAFSKSAVPVQAKSLPYLFLLAVIPTIGGFYFTNKAINHIMAGEVQLIEMSEPFIATLLGFIILKQVISKTDLLGGICIVIGLIILEKDNIKKFFL